MSQPICPAQARWLTACCFSLLLLVSGCSSLDTTNPMEQMEKLPASWSSGQQAAENDASLESLRDVSVSLIAEVAMNYIDLRTAEERKQIANSQHDALQQIYQLTAWRHDAGLGSEIDLLQAKRELETNTATLPALSFTVSQAKNRLAVLLGESPTQVMNVINNNRPIPTLERAAFIGIPSDTLMQRPDLRLAYQQLLVQRARLLQAKATRYPSIKLNGSIGLEALSFSALSGDATRLGALLASITAPIFDSGSISANIEISDAQLEQANLALKSAFFNALEEVENALTGIDSANRRFAALDQATSTARLAFQLSENQYASGLIDFTTVLEGQRSLQSLEDQLVTATGELATRQAELYKALGGGWQLNTTLVKPG